MCPGAARQEREEAKLGGGFGHNARLGPSPQSHGRFWSVKDTQRLEAASMSTTRCFLVPLPAGRGATAAQATSSEEEGRCRGVGVLER